MAGFRKRVFARAFNSGSRFTRGRFKRRRTMKRRFKGRKSSSTTTKSGTGGVLGFRSRRIRPRQYRSLLFKQSITAAHYRSFGSTQATITTPITATSSSVASVNAMDNGVSAFWNASGGAQLRDAAGAATNFNNVVVRGGKIGIRFWNDGSVPAEIKLWLIKTSPRPDFTIIPSTVALGWDPSTIPDFARDFGRIIFQRNFMLEGGAASLTERRLIPMAIDQQSWAVDAQRLFWLVQVTDADNTSAADTVRLVTYFNLSFVGDAIGAS